MKLKRGLFLTHRWLGIGMCLLLSMWFCSGLVLMYVHFPTLTPAERLQHLPPLNPDSVRIAPTSLLEGREISALSLTTILGRPAWLAEDLLGNGSVMYADTGEVLATISADDAARAADWHLDPLGTNAASDSAIDLIDVDQWSVSNSLDRYRPLYRVRIADRSGTVLYVSSRTGQVVRDTTKSERIWNWLGANLHWIYPVALRRHSEVWHWVVVILSSLGLVSIVTGFMIGTLRMRRKHPYRGRDWTPYRGMHRWHHLLGLLCSGFLFTFMLSGLLSMNPFGVFTSDADYDGLKRHYQGVHRETLAVEDVNLALESLRTAGNIRELRWHWLDNSPYPVAVWGAHEYRMLDSADGQPGTGLDDVVAKSALGAVKRADPAAQLLGVARLDDYDSYYYSHAGRWRPLPVLRLQFNDPSESWLYVDGRTGELLSHVTARGRAQRWLYHGLHSLDFSVLINNRPAWDLVLIVLGLLGLAMALTSVVVGVRRMRYVTRRLVRPLNGACR